MKVLLLGSTGLVGDKILHELITNDAVKQITTISRRAPKVSSEKINAIIEKDTEQWYNGDFYKDHDVAISSFGTTRANAGGIEKFKEIDYGNNLKFAKTAKENGVKKMFLVSTGGANPKSFVPYLQIKGQLEEEIKKLDFDLTFLMRPGMLLGEREENRALENIGRRIATWPLISRILPSNDASVVAKKINSLLGEGGKVNVYTSSEINKINE